VDSCWQRKAIDCADSKKNAVCSYKHDEENEKDTIRQRTTRQQLDVSLTTPNLIKQRQKDRLVHASSRRCLCDLKPEITSANCQHCKEVSARHAHAKAQDSQLTAQHHQAGGKKTYSTVVINCAHKRLRSEIIAGRNHLKSAVRPSRTHWLQESALVSILITKDDPSDPVYGPKRASKRARRP